MKIPQFFAESLPRVPETSPQVAALPYEERARLGATLAEVSENLLKTNLKLAEEKQKRELRQAKVEDLNEYELFMAEKEIEEQQRPDKTGYLSRMKYYSLEKQAELLKKYKDPEEARIIKSILEDAHIKNLIRASGKDRAYYIDREKARLKKNTFQFEKRIEKATSEEERKNILQEALSYLDVEGDIDRDWAEGLKIHLQKFTDKVQEDANINKALSEIDSGKFTEQEVNEIIRRYDIPEDKQPGLRNHARIMRNEKKAELDRQISLELVQDINDMFSELKVVPELFITKAVEKLQDPAYLKSKGATLEQGRAAINFIYQGNKTIQEQKWNAIQNEFLLKLHDGTLTPEEVAKSELPATGLTQGDKAWFFAKIKQREMDNDPYLHSNPKVYSDALVSIMTNPKKWSQNKIMALVGKRDSTGGIAGITARDAYQLTKIHNDILNPPSEIAKKYQPLELAAKRLEEYRKNFMFIEVETDKKGNPIVKKEDYIKNDQLHYEALQQLIKEFEEGKDPVVSIANIMKKYAIEKQKSWFDRILQTFIKPLPIEMYEEEE